MTAQVKQNKFLLLAETTKMKFAAILIVVVIIAAAYAEDEPSSEEFQCDPALAAAGDKCGSDPKAEQKCFECLQKKCYKHYEDKSCDQLAQCVKDANCKRKN